MASNTLLANSFTSPQNQCFSLPLTVIFSMLENPSFHKGLMKLYRTCKYFYSKRPILIVDKIEIRKEKNELPNVKPRLIVAGKEVSHLRIPIWLTDTVELWNLNEHQRLPKFFRYSVKKIISKSSLLYEVFLFLTAEKKVDLFHNRWFCYIYHHSDNQYSKASLDEILQHLPNITEFRHFIDETCTLEVLTNLNAMEFNNKLSRISLRFFDTHPSFDLDLFCEFIMKNSDFHHTRIHITPFQRSTMKKLKPDLQKLDPKWKKEACDELKDMFFHIDRDFALTYI